MIGKHNIKISNQRVHFNFDVSRNITVIRGDSATGKTTLINMLLDYEEHIAKFYLQDKNVQKILKEIEL